MRRSPDHPRACGELERTGVVAIAFAGSSPRMRGTQRMRVDDELDFRIIPAHAGNSPHVLLRVVDGVGSSPRMRGTLKPFRQRRVLIRIIPAHAGNSPSDLPSSGARTDHPRACGELNRAGTRTGLAIGSSPRMRGTRRSVYLCGLRCRIIPAHAGNSTDWKDAALEGTDHPRACGELVRVVQNQVIATGSSPRMRGTPHTPGC